MPKKPIDYSNTIIYKLVCKDPDVTDVYVGSTTNFTKRKNVHKSDCHNSASKKYNVYVYQFIRKNKGFSNWDMVEVKRVNCKDKLEASKHERRWLEKLGATLNKQIPSRTNSEYRQDNLEYFKEYYENYRKDNYEKIREWKNTKIQCECGGRYTKCHKARHYETEKHMAYENS
ncbi:MAG: hypothetical protein EOO99_11875 [Pedobacter sp.]|nr:MAG: hypothetical protein EOO99_11875 [Pedobacter sp.]